MAYVDIIVVTYNSEDLVRGCLSSIARQSHKDFNVIIVDNCSQDNSIGIIKSLLCDLNLMGKIKIVSSDKNLGFARAHYCGLRESTSPFVATVNPDVELDPTWLENLMVFMFENRDVGLCASKLVVHGTDMIDSAGDLFTSVLKGTKRGEGVTAALFTGKDYVFGACAGAALYRRKMLDQIGFFDEEFFLIHEDTDLNFRAQLAGWKVLYVPTAIVHHKVRSSIGVMSDTAVYYSLRNSELVRIKNVPFGVFWRCFPQFVLGAISEFLYFAVKHRRFKLFCKAKRDALRMLPQMWKKRRAIMKNRKVSNAYILGLMTPVFEKDFFRSKLRKFVYD